MMERAWGGLLLQVSEKVEPSDDFHGVVEKRAFGLWPVACGPWTDGFQREKGAPFFLEYLSGVPFTPLLHACH